MKLKEMLEICYGKNQREVEVDLSSIPILGTGGIIGYASRPLYEKESVLIGRKGTIGLPFYINKPFWTIDTLFYTKIDTSIILPKYLYYCLMTIGLERYSEGAAVPSLTTKTLYDIDINVPKMEIQQHIVNTIGSLDDLIECNNKFLTSFQRYLIHKYKEMSFKIDNECELSSLIKRTGKLLKQKEWFNVEIIDLSTMPNDNIFISDYSDGSNFATNIKTIGNTDLVYGSIRPYFKKAGFNWKAKYVAGSVFSFNAINKSDYLWILACICSEDFHKYTASNSQGTKMPIINWDAFIKFKLSYSKSTAQEFGKNIEPLFNQALIKLKENDYLKQIKEKLLTKYF